MSSSWLLVVLGCGAARSPIVDVRGGASPEEVASVKLRAEQTLARLGPVLGPDALPRRVVIELLGAAEAGEMPTVDPESGVVRLYTFPGAGGGYSASLSHELVHLCRRALWSDPDRLTDAGLFLEEGLAEVIAADIGLGSEGFPLYGTDLAVAAGQWLEREQDLPLLALIEDHRTLNFRCTAQAYALRLSFVTWLRQTRGLEPLLLLANGPAPVTRDSFEAAMGAPLETLEAEWRGWALRAYASIPDADATAARYRSDTPVAYFPVCGRDGAVEAR